ncbi:hypothetical protein CRG98_033448 [Punica granatum]|uniref:TIR domain-containing protein n=1 Tax=Punica granatum TaxID=22663 RepID=A0A2I0IR96_PUNGR|nr:hypothetical protein CRG98_033448 [Punica granatum]
MAPKRKRTSGTTYQVFLSFRGPDTRQGFTDVLYHTLVDAGIHVFRDNEEIRKGEDIGEEILRAIEESRIFVPIFSTNYASSKWCLIELAKMFESKKASIGKKTILPIFYDVGVHDVKLKTKLYAEALSTLEHEKKCSHREVKQWKKALRKAGKIKGWELNDKGYGEFARSFAREVSMKLKVKHKCVTDYLVQRDDQVEGLMELLDIESTEVRFVGIHGMGGIGKTTLAKLVFNKLCDRFDSCSFLADVRESDRQHKGVGLLQRKLLGDLGLGSGEIMDVDDGIKRMSERLAHKKVLIVLDDVDHRDQIHDLAGDASWFGSGSRILITTRNQRVLEIIPQRVHILKLRDLGRNIIAAQGFKNIVKCSRLWMPEDALEALQQDENKRKIEMLRVRSYDYLKDGKELSSLRNLRYLECSGANFSGDLKHLPKLMWLCWQRCPTEFMGTDLYLRNLVILDLSDSFIRETWGGWSQIGTGNSLKVLDLSNCHCLKKTPDFSKYSSLERLILRGCTKLVEIHPSIGKLRGLKQLDLAYCLSLKGLPEELCCPELIDPPRK